jgi:hypothetical protein
MIDKPGTITAVFSDTQIGGWTALSLPAWQMKGAKPDEAVPYTANATGLWLYKCWVDYWRYICYLAGVSGKHRHHRIISIHVGDIVEGVHHNSLQSLQDVEDQVDMAAEIMTRVANLSDGGVYGVMGTEEHAGRGWVNEHRVAERAGFKRFDPELHLDIDGKIVWAFHHGRAGGRDWSSSAAGVAVEARMLALETKESVPDYVFTAHHHRIDDSGIKLETRAITLPSWQTKTTFGYKVASGRRSDIGGMIMLSDGSLDTSRMRYKAAPGQTRTVRA